MGRLAHGARLGAPGRQPGEAPTGPQPEAQRSGGHGATGSCERGRRQAPKNAKKWQQMRDEVVFSVFSSGASGLCASCFLGFSLFFNMYVMLLVAGHAPLSRASAFCVKAAGAIHLGPKITEDPVGCGSLQPNSSPHGSSQVLQLLGIWSILLLNLG